jgi:hypothetical protein
MEITDKGSWSQVAYQPGLASARSSDPAAQSWSQSKSRPVRSAKPNCDSPLKNAGNTSSLKAQRQAVARHILLQTCARKIAFDSCGQRKTIPRYHQAHCSPRPKRPAACENLQRLDGARSLIADCSGPNSSNSRRAKQTLTVRLLPLLEVRQQVIRYLWNEPTSTETVFLALTSGSFTKSLAHTNSTESGCLRLGL